MDIELKYKTTNSYSALRYPGGKASLASYFHNVFKANSLKVETYIEPYAGGAGAALALLLEEKVRRIVINDLDNNVYSFWYSILNHTDEFISQIKSVDITIDNWRKYKAIYKSDDYSRLEKGFAFFFLNRCNRSGILNAGPIGGINQTGNWKMDARFNRDKLIDRIVKISYYNSRITLKNQDGISLIKEFEGDKKVFVYLDPPYYYKGDTLYMNHYKNSDHIQLSNYLNDGFKKNNWLLTYDDVDEIKQLYIKNQIVKYSINHRAQTFKKGGEFLIAPNHMIL